MGSAVIIKVAPGCQFLRSLVHRDLQLLGRHRSALPASIESTSGTTLLWLASPYSQPHRTGTIHRLLRAGGTPPFSRFINPRPMARAAMLPSTVVLEWGVRS